MSLNSRGCSITYDVSSSDAEGTTGSPGLPRSSARREVAPPPQTAGRESAAMRSGAASPVERPATAPPAPLVAAPTAYASGAPVASTAYASGAPVASTAYASGAPVASTAYASGAPVASSPPEVEFAPGTQVLFVRPALAPPDGAAPTAWELGTIAELLPATGSHDDGDDAGGNEDSEGAKVGSRRVVIVVTAAAPADHERVTTTLRCVRRYTCTASPFDLNDLAAVPEPSDAALLYALRRRYHSGLFYTYVGRALLAVNPYRRSANPPSAPHPRDIVSAVRAAIARGDSCGLPYRAGLVVTGDSGAGKTETAKIVLQHVLGVGPAAERVARVLDATNCLLESFGNAATPLNGNSSRFVKCVTALLHPHSADGLGARVEFFLLESTRLIARLPGESNFHVFGMLFDQREGLTPEERSRFDTWDPALFAAMQCRAAPLSPSSPSYSHSYSYSSLPPHSAAMGAPYTLTQVRLALQLLDWKAEQVDAVLRLLCGILHLLNVDFAARDLFAPAALTPNSRAACATAASLLGFATEASLPSSSSSSSLESLLTTVRLGQDVRQLHCAAAYAARDSVVKFLYEALFRCIVRSINDALAPPTDAPLLASFAVLDIFGFEVKDEQYGVNDLEQLLINYANEAVQRFYENSTFDALRAEAEREGIRPDVLPTAATAAPTAATARDTFDLLVRRPRGVLNVINDDTILAQHSRQEGGANLAAMLASLQQTFPRLIRAHRTDTAKVCVQHYCANITYDVRNMAAKNRIATTAPAVCAASTDVFVRDICAPPQQTQLHSQQWPQGDISLASSQLLSPLTPRPHAATVIAQFSAQMDALVSQLSSSEMFWVRCIKPNINQAPDEFDSAFVHLQLQSGAVLRSLALFGRGHCHAIPYRDFARQYLAPAAWPCAEAKAKGRGGGAERMTSARLAPLREALSRASGRAAVELAVRLLPCCGGGALELGASKVFASGCALRALLALGAEARLLAAQRIGRVGRAFLSRRALAAAHTAALCERAVAAARLRVARELPARAQLEAEREAALAAHSQGRAEALAALGRRAARGSRVAAAQWGSAAALLAAEMRAALGEIAARDAARRRREGSAREEAELRAMYFARARPQRSAQPQRETAAGEAAAREEALRAEILRRRRVEMRIEQDALVARRQRAIRLRERREAERVREHLDAQQRRIAEAASRRSQSLSNAVGSAPGRSSFRARSGDRDTSAEWALQRNIASLLESLHSC